MTLEIREVQNGFIIQEVNIQSPIAGEEWVAADREQLQGVVKSWAMRQEVERRKTFEKGDSHECSS